MCADRHNQPSGGFNLNIFDYFPSRRPGAHDAVNLPKIVRSTMDTGREVNVIEAKHTRSQPKKVISMVSGSTVRANCYSPAFSKSTEESYVTAPSSPLSNQKSRMQFNFNVTPSKGTLGKPTYSCDVNGSRVLNSNNNNKMGTSANAATDVTYTYGIKGKCQSASLRESTCSFCLQKAQHFILVFMIIRQQNYRKQSSISLWRTK